MLPRFHDSIEETMEYSQTRKRKAGEAFSHGNMAGPLTPKVVNYDDDEAAQQNRRLEISRKANLKEYAASLLSSRRNLPIFRHQRDIRNALRSDPGVLLLAGETGSGKSTQVPQFLVDESWCRPKQFSLEHAEGKKSVKVGGCIAITQPRRVAAVSLARRVAEEMGTPLGISSPASKVGYSVRFDNSVSPSTKIKFLTEGMLLQEMLRDPWLKEYSAVIVDEVHERGVNVDLILGFLRLMNEGGLEGRGGVSMKVVVMSATVDMEVLKRFFNPSIEACSDWEVAVATNGDIQNEGEDDEAWEGLSDSGEKMKKSSTKPRLPPTVLSIKGRQYPVQTIYTTQPVTDWVDAAFERIVDIHLHQPLPGDILVFLTGQETIDALQSLCTEYASSLQRNKSKGPRVPGLLVLPLFAALPQSAQQAVFQPAIPYTRKVILSTNIAETSVTVPGVRHVIDSGKSKTRQFRPQLNLDSLLVRPISRSSANQRKGRAGRDAPGNCYRLYTEADYLKLPADNDPEILRCNLSQVVLTLKARGVDEIARFPWLTMPKRKSLERALLHLLQLQALDPTSAMGSISLLGREMALLPLPASLARVLLASALPQYDCVEECIDVIAALSVENVFLNTHHQQGLHTKHNRDDGDEDEPSDPISLARRPLFRREGDHLTLLATVQAYISENSDRRRWCIERGISHRAMQGIMDVRKQLSGIMSKKRKHLSTSPSVLSTRHITDQDHTTLGPRILRTFLTGFLPSTATLQADGSYRTTHTNQPIAIHPSSVLFGRKVKVEAILYHEFVWTNKAWARGVSAVEGRWLDSDVVEG